jgi:hypothetical protein
MPQALIPPFGAPVSLRDYDPDYLEGEGSKKDLKNSSQRRWKPT